MGAGARSRQLPEARQERIAKIRTKKNSRRKKRKAVNARLREAGVKFSKLEACYKGNK